MLHLDIGVPKTDTFNAVNGCGNIKFGHNRCRIWTSEYRKRTLTMPKTDTVVSKTDNLYNRTNRTRVYKGVQKRTQTVHKPYKSVQKCTKTYKSVQKRTKPYTVIRPCTVVRLYGFLGRAESGVVIQ